MTGVQTCALPILFDDELLPVEKTHSLVDWDVSAAEKGGYAHFMAKEIMEQPKAVADTVKPRIKNGEVVFEDTGLTDERLRESEHIHIIGCGSALHAGMVGKRVIEAMCRIRCTAEVASEFRYENPIIGKKDMCIVISQSGETADTLAAMRLAKQAGAFTIAIVNVVSSTIAREAAGVLYTWAGPEISVATTKAYSAQLSALYLISVKIARVRRMITNPLDETAREANLVANLAFDEFQPDLKRGDEIGELNRALSEMAATLHTRWDSERDLEDKRQQFVSAASHDLKTPLALIGGYAEAIAQDISPEENARYLAAIEQETARMNGLVREMLDYTRLDRTDELKNRKTLNLTALVRDVLTEYAPLFEKRRLTADIADGVRIRGDETLLRRAVGCLLENAAKYSPENGRVSVRLTNARNDLLTVENDCEPIPEDELPRQFEMFYRGDKARDRAGGHGLGLAILQKILALHGLTCKAENVKNGVRFIVCNKD